MEELALPRRVATRAAPSHASTSREGRGEALTGVRAGRAMNPGDSPSSRLILDSSD
jgi:hypothetical protein